MVKVFGAFILVLVGVSGFMAHGQDQKSTLRDSVLFYANKGNFVKALSFSASLREKVKSEKGKASLEYAQALHTFGELSGYAGKPREAESALLEGLSVKKSIPGNNSLEIAKSYNSLGKFYSEQKNFKRADSCLVLGLDMRVKELGTNHIDVADMYYSLGVLHYRFEKLTDAAQYYQKAISSYINSVGENNLTLAKCYNNLSAIYFQTGQHTLGEENSLKALAIRKRVLGEAHPSVASIYMNLGNMLYLQGNYKKAEKFFEESLRILQLVSGDVSNEFSLVYANMGALYYDMGNLPKAEKYDVMALDMRQKSGDMDEEALAHSYNNLGILNMEIGDLKKALLYHTQSYELRKKVLGDFHSEFGLSCGNLAEVYAEMGNDQKAESLFMQAIAINRKAKGEFHAETANYLNQLGTFYLNRGILSKSLAAFAEALDIQHHCLRANHPFMLLSYMHLGQVNSRLGRFGDAEENLSKALQIAKANFNEAHPNVSAVSAHMGRLYLQMGQLDKAERYMLKANQGSLSQISQNFPFLSGREQELYLSTAKNNFDNFKALCLKRFASKPAISAELFNLQIATKGILLSNSQKLKQRLRNSNDSLVKVKFGEWEGLLTRIAKSYKSTDSLELAESEALKESAEKLEKEISGLTELIAPLTEKKQLNWKAVQQKLRSGEAVVEMVRIRNFGVNRVFTDSSNVQSPKYKEFGLTDSVAYAALILQPGMPFPEMVIFQNGKKMEGPGFSFYKKSIEKSLKDELSYQKFWGKIGAKLGSNVKRIYFSPDGIYHSINISTLLNPTSGKYLLEEKEIRIITNPRDLLTSADNRQNESIACLLGYPAYNLEKDKRHEFSKRERWDADFSPMLKPTRHEAFEELPGTKKEIENISATLLTSGWKVKAMLGENALEENIKNLQKPRVLHLATHGFFQPDSGKENNAMLYSGLLLSGANKTLAGESDENVEDGILTAYEAMNLNLDNTDLVVLSACETGLGEVKNGEGVYGLQRAFKVAGAKTIIMSLWKVDDEATQELMVSFYRHWLSSDAQGPSKSPPRGDLKGPPSGGGLGGAKRSAFLKAQQELKAKYPHPYFWGAFVMVGE